jgi:hypothetical protein
MPLQQPNGQEPSGPGTQTHWPPTHIMPGVHAPPPPQAQPVGPQESEIDGSQL